MERMKWFDRAFSLGLSADLFPMILERLRGTPAFLEERVGSLPPETLTFRPGEEWSIQEHAGHLLDLEALWIARLEDFKAGRTDLKPADLTNRGTYEANFNAAEIKDILQRFRTVRMDFIEQLEALDGEVLTRTALHPRLKQPMTMVDLAYFVAEHDMNHLALITERLHQLAKAHGQSA